MWCCQCDMSGCHSFLILSVGVSDPVRRAPCNHCVLLLARDATCFITCVILAATLNVCAMSECHSFSIRSVSVNDPMCRAYMCSACMPWHTVPDMSHIHYTRAQMTSGSHNSRKCLGGLLIKNQGKTWNFCPSQGRPKTRGDCEPSKKGTTEAIKNFMAVPGPPQ